MRPEDDALAPNEWAFISDLLRFNRNNLGWNPDAQRLVQELLDKVEAHMVGLEPNE